MKTLTVIGGDLRRIALEQCGDATAFVSLMQLNNLSDFLLHGQVTLQIPDPASPSADGVVQQ